MTLMVLFVDGLRRPALAVLTLPAAGFTASPPRGPKVIYRGGPTPGSLQRVDVCRLEGNESFEDPPGDVSRQRQTL